MMAALDPRPTKKLFADFYQFRKPRAAFLIFQLCDRFGYCHRHRSVTDSTIYGTMMYRRHFGCLKPALCLLLSVGADGDGFGELEEELAVADVGGDEFLGAFDADIEMPAEGRGADQPADVWRLWLDRKRLGETRVLQRLECDRVSRAAEIQVNRSGLSQQPVNVFVQPDNVFVIKCYVYALSRARRRPAPKFFKISVDHSYQ